MCSHEETSNSSMQLKYVLRCVLGSRRGVERAAAVVAVLSPTARQPTVADDGAFQCYNRLVVLKRMLDFCREFQLHLH